jgi:anti-sigma factor RsiW
MNRIDELLNKYIDGELRRDERDEFEKLAASSPELKSKIEAMKLVHSRLLLIQEESPSVNFTAALMKKISRSAKFRRQQNYFIAAVIGFFSLLCIGVVVYFIGGIIRESGELSLSLPELSVPVNSYIHHFTRITTDILHPEFISIIGYAAASAVLLTGFIFFENIRNLKKLK